MSGSHLQEIVIENCPSLVSLEESGLPWTSINLRVLSIKDCSNFGVLPKCINNFTSLQKLTVSDCWADICFSEEGFPTNLTEVAISKAPKIYNSLVEWGFNRLASLQKLSIGGEGCSNVVSFPKQGIEMTLPPSLTISTLNILRIWNSCAPRDFDNSSLQELIISNCPKLTSLPEKDMLLSLRVLSIENCQLLEEGCSRRKGREWSKIAHIPWVVINDKQVIPRNLD